MSVQRRSDAKNPKFSWGQMRSLISRISALCHLGPRDSKTRPSGGCDVAITASPHSSSTPRPSLSTTAVPSSQGCESLSLLHTPPEARTAPASEQCLEPPTCAPRFNDPIGPPEVTSITELTSPTIKQATHPISKTNVLTDVPFDPTFTGIHRTSSATLDDIIDLTGLVQRGRVIYTGQYSDVYQGTYGQNLVAIKVIKSLPSDPLHAVRRRMRREVGTASRFDHPNVLSVCGVIEDDWCQFGGIVSLWCQNGDAGSYLYAKPLTPLARLEMLHGVAAGLEYIHSQSVVHGDLKPGNILIDALGNPLICDFGLVSILDTEQPDRGADNTTTVHQGTVRYLAYELAQDPADERTMASDIHALGCIAYEFLYLEKPYAARSANPGYYIFKDIAEGIPPARRPLPPIAPSIAALWSLLEQCWDRDPYHRPTISVFSSSLRLLTESDLQHHLS